MAALLMATLGVWCGWNTVGEYVLEHRIVTGRAEGARVVRGTRSPNTYQVIIDRQGYNITRDLLAPLQRGDVVEAQVGVASRTILAIVVMPGSMSPHCSARTASATSSQAARATCMN
jgi:hypothetical protein